MNCEKCRWHNTSYYLVGIGVWMVNDNCLLGGCDGSQYEPKDGKMDEEEPRYCDRNICASNEVNGIGCDECPVMMGEVDNENPEP